MGTAGLALGSCPRPLPDGPHGPWGVVGGGGCSCKGEGPPMTMSLAFCLQGSTVAWVLVSPRCGA